jgi:hypothetical protein
MYTPALTTPPSTSDVRQPVDTSPAPSGVIRR